MGAPKKKKINKKPVNSNAKGARHERDIATALSLWVDINRDDIFWRSGGSGGRATMRTRSNPDRTRADVGDLICQHEKAYAFIETWLIECKNYETLHWDACVYQLQGILPDIVDKPFSEAEQHDRLPMVIAKQFRKQIVILTNDEGAEMLKTAAKLSNSTLRETATFWRAEVRVTVFFYNQFLQSVEWKAMRKVIANRKSKRAK